MRYRAAFFITCGIAVLLAGAVVLLVLLWPDPQSIRTRISSAMPKLESASSPDAMPSAPSAQANAPEPNLVPITLTPQRMQSIGVKTGTVQYKVVHDEILTTGNVEIDETQLAEVQVRFAGWIQKVYIDATFQKVSKGQPLLTIYSPELVATENEYLLARENTESLAKSTVPGVATAR